MPPSPECSPSRHVILFCSDRIGDGPEELGRLLVRSYVKTQRDLSPRPWRMIFLNAGITLTTEGSPIEDDLRSLETEGVEILSCGTCLDFFQAKEKVRVGRVSNMREISESLLTADRVVRP